MMACDYCIHREVCEWVDIPQPEFRCVDFKHEENWVEIIRCKDCRYYSADGDYCGFWGECRHPEHFCGEGDRDGS